MGDEYGNAQDFYLTPGDTMSLEYKYTLDGMPEETLGTFTIEASERCLVVYTPIHPERFKLVRQGSLDYYRHMIGRAAKKNGGQLSAQEIDAIFDKQVFYNKLRYENDPK